MSVLRSQFERARAFADAYAGAADDHRWRTPAAAAAAVGGGLAAVVGVAAVGAMADAAPDAAGEGAGEPGPVADGWGVGWDAGWGEAYVSTDTSYPADGGDWSHRGDYTDASVGGSDDFFYFIDGDSSLTIE